LALLSRLRGFFGCRVKAHDMAIVDAKVSMPPGTLLLFPGVWAALLEGLTADRPQFTRSMEAATRGFLRHMTAASISPDLDAAASPYE
jgi:hypothetical protein